MCKHVFNIDWQCKLCLEWLHDIANRNDLYDLDDSAISAYVRGYGKKPPEATTTYEHKHLLSPPIRFDLVPDQGKSEAWALLAQLLAVAPQPTPSADTVAQHVWVDELEGVQISNIAAEVFYSGPQWLSAPMIFEESDGVIRGTFAVGRDSSLTVKMSEPEAPWYERSHTPKGKATLHDAPPRAFPHAEAPALSTVAWRDRDRG